MYQRYQHNTTVQLKSVRKTTEVFIINVSIINISIIKNVLSVLLSSPYGLAQAGAIACICSRQISFLKISVNISYEI